MGKELIWIAAAFITVSITSQGFLSQGIAQEPNVIEEAIRKALRGDVQRTSDPELDRILSELRKRGSLLKGSVVDELSNGSRLLEEHGGPGCDKQPAPQPDLHGRKGARKDRHHSKRAIFTRAAEQLLKAARKIEHADPEGVHAKITNDLRAFAGELLQSN